MARPLFVLGASRSGTTALTNYLNEHEQMMICMERYKRVPGKLTPELLTFRRVLDYEPQFEGGETNIARERQEDIVAGKDPAKLRWIGDKQGAQGKRYRLLTENNPGAHFLITYRPIEEVVESFQERSRESTSPVFAGKDGLKNGVAGWNRAMASTRDYLENNEESNGLIVSYNDFFYRPRNYAPLLSEFLELEFDEPILQSWELTTREFEGRRREKARITDEQAEYIREHKDHEAEEWMLERIARQWVEPGLYKKTTGREQHRQKVAAATSRERSRRKEETEQARQLELRAHELQDELTRETRKAEAAERRRRALWHQMQAVRGSRSWRVLQGFQKLRSAAGRAVGR